MEETGAPHKLWELTSARWSAAGGGPGQGWGLEPPGVLAWKSGAAHTCTPRPCSWSTRARRALIPLRRSSRCSTDEMPRLTRSLRRRRAGQTQLLFPTFCCPSHPLPSPGTGIRTGWASHAGRGRAPGPFRLTGQSWRPQPLGSHSRRQRSCPCSGPGPGPPATCPRSQRRGRWRRHGPPGAWEAWGAEEQWSVDSRDLGPRPGHSPEERSSENGQEEGKMAEPPTGLAHTGF